MAKKLFFASVLAVAAIMLTTNLSAHEAVDTMDSVCADSVVVDNDVDEIDEVDEVIEIVDSAYTDEEGAEIDSVLMEKCPSGNTLDTGGNQRVNKNGIGWMIHSLYFMDRKSWKKRAVFRKELNEPRWYYYEPVPVDDYKVLSDAAHPFLMQNTYESDKVATTFTYCGDSIRIHHCGDYPKESPKYSLLVVTKKEVE